MLIGPNGEKEGVVSIDEALARAKEYSLDLVQVSGPQSDPIVCKLMDYGKYVFDRKKIFQHLNQK